MACCPPVPVITIGGSPDLETGIADTPMLRGESAECFMATANNPTGKHDDATGNVENKIDTMQIPMKIKTLSGGRTVATVDITFKMQDTPASPKKRTPTKWQIKDDTGGTPVWLHPAANNLPADFEYNNNDPVRVDGDNYSSGPTLRLHGTFRTSDLKKQYRCTVAAHDDNSEIDNKGYVFSPDTSPSTDNIQLLHPLPGATCNSRFAAQRLNPYDGIVKPHNGCDFKFDNKSIGDVVAAADGEVILANFSKSAGNWTKIKHLNGAGKHLCTTVYMHQAKIYVKVGQKVSAGQKIGREGSTGGSTGPHLHFECRLPNSAPIDPLPLIKGNVKVAQTTDSANNAVTTDVRPATQTATLTPANVDAKIAGCKPFGPDYPTPTAPDTVPPAPVMSTTDPYELAWALTMDTEVISWEGSPPSRLTTIAGTIAGASPAETKTLKRRVGFVDHPADPGGVTKFGIAQKFNKGVKVEDVTYANAHDAGYEKYWNTQLPKKLVDAGKPRAAIAAFNICFLCGPGGVQTIVNAANVGSLSDAASIDPICDSMKAYLLRKIVEKPSKEAFKNGWMARVEKVRAYAKTVTL